MKPSAIVIKGWGWLDWIEQLESGQYTEHNEKSREAFFDGIKVKFNLLSNGFTVAVRGYTFQHRLAFDKRAAGEG